MTTVNKGGTGPFLSVYEQTHLLAKSNLTLTRWNDQHIPQVTQRASRNVNTLQRKTASDGTKERKKAGKHVWTARSMQMQPVLNKQLEENLKTNKQSFS